MFRFITIRAACFLMAFALPMAPAWAGPGTVVQTEHVHAELMAYAPEGIGPGKPAWLGLAISHQPVWHTYWKNPGDSGLPTTLSWTLPAGKVAGEIAWPAPKKLPVGPLLNYGYEGELLLPVPLTIAAAEAEAGAAGGRSVDVALRADWLVCREVCIPESGEFLLQLPVGVPVISQASRFERSLAATPKPSTGAVQASVRAGALALQVEGLPAQWRGHEVDAFIAEQGVIDHAAKPVQRWEGDRLLLQLPLSVQRSASPDTMQAVLRQGDAAVELDFQVASGWADEPAPADASSAPLVLTLGLAFVGGLLLNLMPCVFPVLSLKLFGFAAHGHDRRVLAAGGFAYTAGVVAAFVALAALLLGLRAAGGQLGWGFQLQSPTFVAALALLFTLIGLNLLGLFEIAPALPASWGGLKLRHPVADHALTGVLAVLIASPCTAPFMGAALGAALTLPSGQALAVFAVLGTGMAAPYLAASLWPGLGRWMPRPGAWMVRFKALMAIPMFATVAWLVWVLAQQVGTPEAPPAAAERWQAWSPEAVAEAQAERRPVFVDFTAAWCVTCQFNKRTTLASSTVKTAFKDRKVLLLRADWTRRDAAISAELARLGRSGVPVYAVYSPGAAGPRLLSEILSPDEVRTALGAASP